MGGTRVKICGINSHAAYDAARPADWIGLVFFPPSPRAVTPQRAAELIRPGGPLPVGLFVDPSDDQIAATLAAVPLEILQVVAEPARIVEIRHRHGRPVWRAVAMSDADDLPGAMLGADGLLLDARAPAGSALPGGNAEAFDWSLLHGWRAPGPWILAGGLTAANVGAAISQTDAPAVDVSSGVESERGVKSPAMITAFIDAVRKRP